MSHRIRPCNRKQKDRRIESGHGEEAPVTPALRRCRQEFKVICYCYCLKETKTENALHREVVAHAFHSSAQKAKAGGSL